MRKKGRNLDWLDYWGNDNAFSPIMKCVAPHFIKTTKPLLNYNSHDVVLDIGCGPGELEYYLKDMVKEVHAVDTSEKYIDECRQRYEGEDNLFFYKLDAKNYTDLSFLINRDISIIICLSVVQYYRDMSEVESLIESLKDVAGGGATFLLADLPVKRGALADIWSNLCMAAREKILIQMIRFMINIRFSNYSSVRSSKGLLCFSEELLKQLVKDTNVKAELLADSLTFNRHRLHLLITF